MESLVTDVNWTAVVVGAIAAYALGALWYSPKLFGTKWAESARVDMNNKSGMVPSMTVQAIGVFLLAWVIGITERTEDLALALLIALMVAILIKANGMFAQKGKYAVVVESTFIIAMVIVMIIAQAII